MEATDQSNAKSKALFQAQLVMQNIAWSFCTGVQVLWGRVRRGVVRGLAGTTLCQVASPIGLCWRAWGTKR